MSFTLQDDNGSITTANAYITVAYFKSYCDDRAISYAGFSDTAIQAAIVLATDYVDTRFDYKGKRLNGRQQPTEFPRSNCYDADRRLVIGIPVEVKDAVSEYAHRALSAELNPDPVRDETGQTVTYSSETVGPVTEVKSYSASSGFSLPHYPAADLKLKRAGLTTSSGSASIRRG